MKSDREKLIELLRRAATGGPMTNDDLFSAVGDPRELEKHEKTAWHALSQWADDDDIRDGDARYGDMQREKLRNALSDLEALEAGYDPQEVDWGDHQANRIPLLGCLSTLAILALLFYLAFRNGFFMHGD